MLPVVLLASDCRMRSLQCRWNVEGIYDFVCFFVVRVILPRHPAGLRAPRALEQNTYLLLL